MKEPQPARPPDPDVLPAFSMAFSGRRLPGDARRLGVVRFMADAGLLDRVRWVSSVSGGSVAHGLLARDYAELRTAGFAREAIDRLVISPFVEAISTTSLTSELLRNLWRAMEASPDRSARGRVRSMVLSRAPARQLPEGCRFIFNASSITTGVRFGFERDVVGDWVFGRAATAGSGIRMSQAVAASAAVPGAFAPFEVKHVSFPCSGGVVPKLLDGGAYDNMGSSRSTTSGRVPGRGERRRLFATGAYGSAPDPRPEASAGLLYRQTTALRMRSMVERFKALEDARAKGEEPPPWARLGVLFGLATTLDATEEWLEGRPDHDEWRVETARLPTVFSSFSAELCRKVIYRTWWLTGAVLSRYHRQLLPAELPTWNELP